MAAQAQSGRFSDGYTAVDRGVAIKLSIVHDGPRCRHDASCPWMIIWESKKQALRVEIAVTVAGFDSPVSVVDVPGKKLTPHDLHNPIFQIPLATVRSIDFTFRNGTKQVGTAHFQ